MRYAGTAEAAELLGVNRQRINQLADQPDFPKPLATLHAGRIWDRADIIAYGIRTGRIPPGDEDETL